MSAVESLFIEDEDDQRDLVDRIAREWCGTPYHDHGEIKGGGTDCAKLLKCVYVEAGLVKDFVIPHYAPQFFLHQAEEIYLGIVRKIAREIDVSLVKHGDIVLYKVGKCFAHGAIVVKPGWPHIIHAHYASKMVVPGLGMSVHLGTPIIDMKFFSRWW